MQSLVRTLTSACDCAYSTFVWIDLSRFLPNLKRLNSWLTVYENSVSIQLMTQAVSEASDSIRLMIQAKIIWFWIDSWFNSESFKSLLTWEVPDPFLFNISHRISWPQSQTCWGLNFFLIDSVSLFEIESTQLMTKMVMKQGFYSTEASSSFWSQWFDSTHDQGWQVVAKSGFNHWFLPVKTGWQKMWGAKSGKK